MMMVIYDEYIALIVAADYTAASFVALFGDSLRDWEQELFAGVVRAKHYADAKTADEIH